jgi:hypothetical protein
LSISDCNERWMTVLFVNDELGKMWNDAVWAYFRYTISALLWKYGGKQLKISEKIFTYEIQTSWIGSANNSTMNGGLVLYRTGP